VNRESDEDRPRERETKRERERERGASREEPTAEVVQTNSVIVLSK
jgi:hypothetical protein